MKISELYRIDDKPNTAPSLRDEGNPVGKGRVKVDRSIAGFLRGYRASKKLSREEMAYSMGNVSKSYYNALEKGGYKLNERLLVRITNHLKLTKAERKELYNIWVQDSGVWL